MGRHAKLAAATPTKAPRAAVEEQGAFEDVALLERTKALIERLFGAIEDALEKGDANASTLHEASGLARAVATLDGARLAREKARTALARKLNRALVLEYARHLDAIERTSLLDDIKAIDETGSVLS